jgi:hypothetical protein
MVDWPGNSSSVFCIEMVEVGQKKRGISQLDDLQLISLRLSYYTDTPSSSKMLTQTFGS